MTEDADAKAAGRPQRTTRSERRRPSRRPPGSGEPGSELASTEGQEDDEASSFDTLVDVEVSAPDDAAEADSNEARADESDAGQIDPAPPEAASQAVASGDTFEALDDDDSRPTREMKVVVIELSEDDKTVPRIRVEELAARLQSAEPTQSAQPAEPAKPEPPESDARVEPPAMLSQPTAARALAAPVAPVAPAATDQATHPRIVVVKTTSVVITPARIIGVEGVRDDEDFAPRMASRPPPPSTPIASLQVTAGVLPHLPRPTAPGTPHVEQVEDDALVADDPLEADADADADEHIVDVDVDVAELESARQGRTPPPPPGPEAKLRTSVVPKRPPPPPASPVAIPAAAPVAAAAAAPAVPPPPPPPPPPVATTSPGMPPAQVPAAASQPVATPRPEDEQKKRKQARQWWERFFSEDYLRAVQPPTQEQISRQVDFIVESLGLERGATILDVGCGLGLHCVELTRRGYLTVGLDLSLAMITRAAEAAQRQSLKINFLHADIREMQFDGAFDAAICMGTTFGFFDDESNRDVLARLHQALRPGGRLLLDVANRDYVMPLQPNLVWFEGEGCVCMEESDFNHYTSRLSVKRTMMREDGTQSSSEYSLRLYSLHELGQLIQQMGFRVLEVSGQEAVRGAFFGACAPRIMILAERRSPARGSQVMPPERPSVEMLRPLPPERASAELPKPPPPKPPGPQSA